MSVENPKPKQNLRTQDDVLKYLKDKGEIRIPTKQANKIINSLLDLGKKYNPAEPSMTINILYKIGRLGINFSEKQVQDLFKELTGYDAKDVIKFEPEEHSDTTIDEEEPAEELEDTGASHDVDSTDLVPVTPKTPKKQNEPAKRKSLLDIVADAKITDLTVDMVKFGFKSYPKIKGNNKLFNILKGTGLVTLTGATIIGGSGAILAARAVRLVGKGLKAVKGTAAKALHTKALNDMKKTKDGLEEQKKMLEDFSKQQRVVLDSKVEEYGLDAENGYKFIKQLRDGKVTTEECEKVIIAEYDSISQTRDINLTRILNSDTLEVFKKTYGIDEDKMADFISRTTVDQNGDLVFPEGTSIDVSAFHPEDFDLISTAIRDESLVMSAQESSKLAASKYVEYKNGVVSIKDGVDINTLPKETARIVFRMQGKKVPEGLFNQVVDDNQSIEVLLMCEEEILTNTAIEANREMTEIYVDRGELVGEQTPGLFKSGVEAITAASLRAKAKNLVERRIDGHIFDSITRNNGATERLLTLAREKLFDRDVETKGKDDQEIVDGQPVNENEGQEK